jgi:putative protease
MADKKPVGEITHFFTNINVAVIKLSGTLKAGEKILIEGATTNFEQAADSMQIEHKEVKEAKKGDSIGLKVKERVREGDKVYRVK